MYKPKFTLLQQGILRKLFMKAGMSFNGRTLAKELNVSPMAISKSIKGLGKSELISIKDDSGRLSISLNKENALVFQLKRTENLKMIYESKIMESLSDKFPGSVIVLFGSYSFGEDTINSDIDIAIIGVKEKDVDLSKFEKILERSISLNFYDNIKDIDKNLKEGIINGIVLKGAIQL